MSSFFFHDTATTEIYTLSLHDALPISTRGTADLLSGRTTRTTPASCTRAYAPPAARTRGSPAATPPGPPPSGPLGDRKSTRLNSSHSQISYAVFCLKKKKKKKTTNYVL